MKREIKITIIGDHTHYALVEQVNNRENEIDAGIYLDKDQYEQLRQHFVGEALRQTDVICRLLQRAELIYGKDGGVTYKIEMFGDEPWIVKHTYIPWERDDVIQLVRVNDL